MKWKFKTFLTQLAFGGILLMGLSGNTMAQAPLSVVVTIPPLAGMVAPLLNEEDKVEVLLQEGASPHGFALKPSHLRLMKHADVNLMVGSPVDAWAQKNLAKYPNKTLVLNQLEGIERLDFRKGGLWEKNMPNKPAGESHSFHGHAHASEGLHYDGHLWMSIQNAKVFVKAFASQLQHLRPKQASLIEQRTQRWLAKIEQTETRLAEQFTTFQNQPFMVLHDAFQYFENHFQLNGIGSIRLNPEVQPSIKRLLALRKTLKTKKVRCIFKEPQFPSSQIEKLAEGTRVNIGELDPMGYRYAQAENQPFVTYDVFIHQLGTAFLQCFQK